jgi:LuxR family maltose regulon positive regulatory protein
MHLVILTREDPPLPLARLRARAQLTELRAADLRFTPAEAAEFLNRAMGLNLSAQDINALETRTEGWIAGLQLAAISMRGHEDAPSFIKSFTGSHRFVVDYLLEEVLGQQSERVQKFLLRTSILERMCGPLCDAVLLDSSGSGQATLEILERANLFIVPLDSERRWYRYHHLFAELLRQRLLQSLASPPGTQGEVGDVTELHNRASQWYEDHGMQIEAFRHAAAANDIERAERLIEGTGVPLHFRGVVTPVLHWLESLPGTVLDARPSLWVMYASAVFFAGQITAVEPKLKRAEAVLSSTVQGNEPDEKTRDLIGRIASTRATLAVIQHDAETIITQSRRALEYLHREDLLLRTASTWTLGYAYQLQGDRASASQAYTEVLSIGKSLGDSIYTIAATLCLGQVQESNNQLHQAVESYQRVLQLAGNPPQPIACEAHLGLARIHYEWNDLDAAEQHGQQGLQLARQIETGDTFASYELFLARLKLARGDVSGAAVVLEEAEAFVRKHNFLHRLPDVVTAQVITLLRQGNLADAAQLAQTQDLPASQARVHLAEGDPSAALAVLMSWHRQVEAKGWQDEQLKVRLLQSVAHHAQGEKVQAMQVLGEALALGKPGGMIRIFLDEGLPMFRLLSEAVAHGLMMDYAGKILAAFEAEGQKTTGKSPQLARSSSRLLIEPLSERELEVLKLLRTELNGPEIARELLVSLNTMRTHTKNIYNKLGVNSRRAAIRRAEELDLL